MAQRKRFDEKTKKAALADIQSGMTLADVADKYGASVGSIQNWKKKMSGPSNGQPNAASPHVRLQEITRILADLENEKESIQHRMRAEQAMPRIKEILLNLNDADMKKLEVVVPALAEQARFLRSF